MPGQQSGLATEHGNAMAGESAEHVYQQQREKRQRAAAARWPLIATVSIGAGLAVWGGFALLGISAPWVGAIVALAVAVRLLAPSQSEVAWRRGAEGERIVGEALERLADRGVQALHDRRIPKSKANIDHLAVTPSGVFTVDAKRYRGKLEVRTGGDELWVAGCNRSKLLDQAQRQAEVTRTALADAGYPSVPVHPALCFVETEWPLLFRPKHADGVILSSPKWLADRLLPDGEPQLTAAQVEQVAAALAARLPPAAGSEPGVRPATPPAPTPPPANPPAAPTTSFVATSPPSPATTDATSPDLIETDTPSPPTCRCGAIMVERTRRKNGQSFYGCSTFPDCRHTGPIEA